ncbi:MAG: 1-acyl-sn-glycerol-3-phosphate acyltransferase [Bacilli bacterium]|jgi:1-acyl-sn-glycerol-3-phosphate acyltransferase
MIKRPNPFLWLPLAGILKVSAYLQGNRLTNKIKIKKPAIILSNHASFRDYIYVTAAAYPHRVNYMAAAKMFYEPERRPFLKLARAIPTCSFQGDVHAVANALYVLKHGGIIGIFPEGQISYHGASLKPPYSIAKFLKRASVNVYVVQNRNAYLMAPPWTNKVFKGKVYTSMNHLFTPKQLAEFDESAIFSSVEKALFYDAGAANAQQKLHYKINDIANLENLIYQCPNCGREGLVSSYDRLVCPECNHELIYDQYGLLDGKSVFENYERQRIALEKLIDEDENFKLETPVRLVRYKGVGLAESGHGVISLNRDFYIYRGTDRGAEVEYGFRNKIIQYLPADIGGDIQIYDKYEVYQFYMDIRYLPIKFSTSGEYFYQLKNNCTGART